MRFSLAYFGGVFENCRWAFVRGPFTGDDVQQFADGIRSINEASLDRMLVLDIAYEIDLPTPLQRKQITDAVLSIEDQRRVVGHALVCDSPVARGILAAVNWFVERSFPEKVFQDPSRAAQWLKEQDAGVDPERLLAHIERSVPEFGTLRW